MKMYRGTLPAMPGAGAPSRQCLARRIVRQDTLERQVRQGEEGRNAAAPSIRRQFTTSDARIKLGSLYPSPQC